MNFKDYCKLREEEMPASPQAGGGGEGWAAKLAQAASSLPPYALQQSVGKLNAFNLPPQGQQDQQGQQPPQGHPQQAQQAQQGVSPNWVGQQPGMN